MLLVKDHDLIFTGLILPRPLHLLYFVFCASIDILTQQCDIMPPVPSNLKISDNYLSVQYWKKEKEIYVHLINHFNHIKHSKIVKRSDYKICLLISSKLDLLV